ncbi:MAG TPA: hypothetical protein VFF73_19805 [Planctomycetota bacterium]|nr:hypothetical protein [Planctomycetota bacterium]
MMNRRKIQVAALATLLVAGSALLARAQDTGKPATDKPTTDTGKPADKPQTGTGDDPQGQSVGENTLTTKFVEAYQVQDYEKAAAAFAELIKTYPLPNYTYAKDPAYVYKYSVALYNTKRKDEAQSQLQQLLQDDPENILAMYLMAQIKAEQATKDKPQPLADSKDFLLQAAKNGFYTIRELRGSKNPAFKQLQEDPKFILAAMRASQDFQAVNQKGARNPFQYPHGDKTDDPNKERITGQELLKMEAKIKDIFDKIEALMQNKEIDKLAPLFDELTKLMVDYKKNAPERVEQNLKRWEKRLDEWKEIRLSIQLNVDITKGNNYLRAMVKAKQAEKYDQVQELFGEVKGLCESMRKEDREEFTRNADAIYLRAKGLSDEAAKMKKIKEFNLIVTGIVVDPRPGSTNKAIIVFDDPNNDTKKGQIYTEGDSLKDREGKPVPGLKLVKIQEGTIQFQYEDQKFNRPLKSPENNK